MIDYLMIRNKHDREVIGIVDTAKSVIWHSVYYGVGDFEIYVQSTSKHVELMQEGYYVTRNGSDEVGVIEHVETEDSTSDGTMLVVKGRFAKSILDRRHIYQLSGHVNTPTVISGNVETAIRSLVTNNAISCTFDSNRNISFLKLGTSAGITKTIVDASGNAASKQVSFDNLLDYTDDVLQEYELGSIAKLNDEDSLLYYTVYEGTDRSADNTAGNDPVIFSKEYDNLTESTYTIDTTSKKTAALIGGAGQDLERFYSLIAGTATGIDRRETFVDASSLNRTYKDENEEEQTYTDAQYTAMLNALGKQELAATMAIEAFEASINVNGGVWALNEDYYLGDIVTFQDNALNIYANARIVEITEVQDESGYQITPVFDFLEISGLQVLGTEESNYVATENSKKLGVQE